MKLFQNCFFPQINMEQICIWDIFSIGAKVYNHVNKTEGAFHITLTEK